MPRSASHRAVLAAGTAAVLLHPGAARAYNWKTHVRMTEVAAELMQPGFASSIGAPPGVDQQLWTRYLGEIAAAYDKLNALRTGLPDAGSEAGSNPFRIGSGNPRETCLICGHLISIMRRADGQKYDLFAGRKRDPYR